MRVHRIRVYLVLLYVFIFFIYDSMNTKLATTHAACNVLSANQAYLAVLSECILDIVSKSGFIIDFLPAYYHL